MLINLSELSTCEGRKKVYKVDVDLSVVKFNGETYDVIKQEPFELTMASTGAKKFFIEGSTSVTVEIPCARCLEPVPYICELDLTRELELKDHDADKEDILDKEFYLNGYNLDVDQLVYSELLQSLPMRVLCSENCKGICNRCGTNLNHGTCACDTSSFDPRMSVIQDIFKEFKEV
ncbi:MAG: DUF177 domain-containing protein [Clostridium sp.]